MVVAYPMSCLSCRQSATASPRHRRSFQLAALTERMPGVIHRLLIRLALVVPGWQDRFFLAALPERMRGVIHRLLIRLALVVPG
jgi:hypothetical protein